MTYSIGLFFDQKTEEEIRRIWQVLAESQISDYLHFSNNRPHITLAIFEDLDLVKTSDLLCDLAGHFQVFDISFQSVGIFPNTTVFLAPLVTRELLDFQKKLHEHFLSFSKLPEMPYFLPGKWVPHCSLAIDFESGKQLEAIQKILNDVHLPLNGKAVELGLTSFHPVIHLMKCELSGE